MKKTYIIYVIDGCDGTGFVAKNGITRDFTKARVFFGKNLEKFLPRIETKFYRIFEY